MLNLTIVLLCANANGYIVGRFDLACEDEEDETWSVVLSKLDWTVFLWSLTHMPKSFMHVVVKGEELLNGN